MHDLLILGGGPAGLTAGLYAARAKLNVLLLEKQAPGGAMLITEAIEDYPGVGRVAGWELADAFVRDATGFGLPIENATVLGVHREEDGTFRVETDGQTFRARAVIATTGGEPLRLGVPGEMENLGRGVSNCATCDGPMCKGKPVVVVGGGEAAVEEAAYLCRFASEVHVIHRRDAFRASQTAQDHLLAHENVRVYWNATVTDILADGSGVTGVAFSTPDARAVLSAHAVFVFIGFRPNTQPLEPLGHLPHDERGAIVTGYDMGTPAPGLFIAGDLRSQLVRQVTTAVGDGTTAAVAAELYLRSH